MNYYLKQTLLLLFAPFLFVACNEQDSMQIPEENTMDDSWYEVLKEEDLTVEELADRIYGRALRSRTSDSGDEYDETEDIEQRRQQFLDYHAKKEQELAEKYGINGFALTYRSAVINYNGVNIHGANVLMSARLLWGHSLWFDHDPNYIGLVHGNTITNNNHSLLNYESAFYPYIATDDGLVILPDYLGFGVTEIGRAHV